MDSSAAASAERPTSTRRWLWRCAECGHGRNLYAYAQANAFGPLDADGTLARHDSVDECFTWEDSIQCEVHPSAVIEHRVGARFFRWRHCGRCEGTGKVRAYSRYRETEPCGECKGEGGWWDAPGGEHRG